MTSPPTLYWLVLVVLLSGCARHAARAPSAGATGTATHPEAESIAENPPSEPEQPAVPHEGPHALRGVVLDEKGQPVPDAEVTLSALGPYSCVMAGMSEEIYLAFRDNSPFVEEEPGFRRSTRTDARGAYSFEALPEVIFGLVVAKGAMTSREQVVTPTAELPPVEVRLQAPVKTRLEVMDEDKRPLPNVEVLVGAASHEPRTLRTDGSGQLVFESSPPNMIHIRAHAEGLTSAVTTATAGSRVPVILYRPRRVTGVVTRDGKPVAGAQVEVSAAEVEPVETDANGRFVFEGLPGEPLLIRATHGARHSETAKLDLQPGSPPEIALALQPGAVVEVTVTRGDGSPFPGAGVSLRFTGIGVPPPLQATTDARGIAVFEDVFQGGMGIVVVEATSPGHAPASSNLGGVRSGKRSRLSLVLVPAHTLKVSLKWSGAGAPPAEVQPQIELLGLTEGTDSYGNLESEGSLENPVEVQGLPAGEYAVRVGGPFASQVVKVQVPGPDVTIAFGPGRTVKGRVVDEKGNGVPGFRVTAWDPTWPNVGPLTHPWAQRAVSDKQGGFELEGVGDGVWQLGVKRMMPNVSIGQKQSLPAGAGEVTIRVRLADLRVNAARVLSEFLRRRSQKTKRWSSGRSTTR